MRHRRLLRRGLLVACAAVIAVALSGCDALLNTFTPNNPTAVAIVGQCWIAPYDDLNIRANWDNGYPIPCSQKHTLYTFAVPTLSSKLPKDWSEKGDKDVLRDSVSEAAQKACGKAFDKFLPKHKWYQELLNWYFYLPSRAEWKNGKRWVRCDLAVFAYNVPLTDRDIAALPENIEPLKKAVGSDPNRFRLCIEAKPAGSTAGPFNDPKAKIADCRKDPTWRLAAHGAVDVPAGADFPGTSEIQDAADAICLDKLPQRGIRRVAYGPTADVWAAGRREVQCWTTTQ
jgi:hypothetical protein